MNAELKDIVIGNKDIFLKAMDTKELPADQKSRDLTFMGVPVVTSDIIPDGVYCMVPHNEWITHPDTVIGAMSGEYTDAAMTFATILGFTRANDAHR